MKRSKLRILFLGTQISIGGAQRVLLSQAKWFTENGYDVTTAFFYDKENLKGNWETQFPFPVVDLKARKLGVNPVINLFLLLGGLYRLWKLIRQKKFDLIETFTPDSNLLGLFISRLAKVPVRIGSHHGYIEGTPLWKVRLHGWLVNSGFAHCLVVVSDHVYKLAFEKEKVRSDQMVIILNGIDPTRFGKSSSEDLSLLRDELGLEQDDFVYLSVGRVTMQKGYESLLDAVPNVLVRFPEKTVFIIAGEGYLQEALERKARRMGIKEVVHFLGTRADIPELLSLANVFVMPSLSEGLPLALLEAMSTGLPVVASRVGGIQVVVKHGVNGYLLPPKDVEALSLALIRIRENGVTSEKIGKCNKNKIQKEFNINKMCSQYENLFLRIYQQERLKQ